MGAARRVYQKLEKSNMSELRRIVDIGTTRFTRVVATDGPGAGGANHAYTVEHVDAIRAEVAGEDAASTYAPFELGKVVFAHGQFGAKGPSEGVFNEDLIAMVIDRLNAFQAGPYRCLENAVAITKLEEAMMWLGKRTADRERRGVLGTDKV